MLYRIMPLLQDSTFGQVVRLVSGYRFVKYEEEKDPSLWRRYGNLEKSGRLACHGHIGLEDIPEDARFDLHKEISRSPSSRSSG